MAVGQSKALFQSNATGGLSTEYAERGDGNAVVLEAWPDSPGGAPSATIQLLDSADPTVGMQATLDPTGLQSGITGRIKVAVFNVLPFVRASLAVGSGKWNVRVTPIESTGSTTVNATVSGTVNQGAAGAAAWPTTGATYTAPATGELAGATSATQLPNIACKLVRFKAAAANAGKVYLGTSASVTAVNGTTDTTTGFQLSAGDDTGWIPVDTLSRFYRICDNAGDALTYMALA